MRDARIVLPWADGDHAFRLGWGELAELQEKCDAGPYVILTRLSNGTWRVEDIVNVIRLGLIGGGMDPIAALKKARTYVEARPPLENLPTAAAVLSAAVMGAPEEKVGEPDAANRRDGSTTSPTEKSDLPRSTEPAPSSATRRKTSTG